MSRRDRSSSILHPPSSARWLTQAAFLLVIVLVIARATMLETTRDPFEVMPGSMPYPRGLGAAGSVVLDWLVCAAPLLILIRCIIDRSFSLVRVRSFIPLALLGIWAAASSTWATDRFPAVVGASHFIGAIAIFWAMAQLVRSGLRVRFVAAACVGLLLVIVANGLIYKFVELPDLQRSIEQNWQQILTERGWQPGSFMEQQFRRKVMSGEMVGFSASPNTLAAILVLLSVVAVGVVIQRLTDRDKPAWAWLVALPLPLVALIIWFTNSRAALVTPVLALVALGLLALARPIFASRRGHAIVFAIMCLVILAAIASLVSYGVSHDKLFGDSLTFRWKYWIGTSRLIRQHAWLGVGWGNFGDHYLAVRELVASEEIKDPHNLVMRFVSELGAVGGILLLVWLLATWWELTRPVARDPAAREAASGDAAPPYGKNVALPTLIWTSAGAAAVNTLCSVDFAQDASFVFIELMKRVLYFGLILIGFVLVAIRSFDRQELDDRTAPWIVRAMLVALGAFLLHNMIDISFFESGPMLTFMMIAGATMGMNSSETPRASSPAKRVWVLAPLAAAWVAALFAVVVPLTVAESKAQSADDAIRARNAAAGARLLLDAYDSLPFANADYLYRAGFAQMAAAAPVDDIRKTLRDAMRINPASSTYPRRLAEVEIRQPQPEPAVIRELFERSLALNPNDVTARIDYAKALEMLGLKIAAAEQYRLALEKNEGLSKDEPKRLPADEVQKIRSAIDRLTR